MVAYIKSDLEFILAQIKIAEAHAAGTPLTTLIPTYNLSWGLRTVDGTYNHLLPGQEQWGAADVEFPSLLDPTYRPAEPSIRLGPPGSAANVPTTIRQTIPARSSSTRACVPSPTCSSTRRWATRLRS